MTERMFIIIGAFLFGYCIGYYPFDIFKYKNRKYEIDDFFSSYNKKHGMQRRIFYQKNGSQVSGIVCSAIHLQKCSNASLSNG